MPRDILDSKDGIYIASARDSVGVEGSAVTRERRSQTTRLLAQMLVEGRLANFLHPTCEVLHCDFRFSTFSILMSRARARSPSRRTS